MEKSLRKEIKAYAASLIETELSGIPKKAQRRIESVCRSQINRLSYKLFRDGNKIYLLRDEKEIIIESKSTNDAWSYFTYDHSQRIIEKVKAKYPKPVKEEVLAV